MTDRCRQPAASAASPSRPSVSRIDDGPPAQSKRGTCRPTSIAAPSRPSTLAGPDGLLGRGDLPCAVPELVEHHVHLCGGRAGLIARERLDQADREVEELDEDRVLDGA